MENPLPQHDTVRQLTLLTTPGPEAFYHGSRRPKYFEIFTEGDDHWKYTTISAFLNDLDDYFFRNCRQNSENKEFFTFTFDGNNWDKSILIHMYEDWTFKVFVTQTFLETKGFFENKDVVSDVGSQNRKLSKPKLQTLYFYKITYPL